MIKGRMSTRGFTVGSNERTAPVIEASFKSGVKKLEAHLQSRPFLFGERPSFADFGLAPQIYQALIDPTAGRILEGHAPKVVAWCTSMLHPVAAQGGAFETWDTLKATLAPLIQDEVHDFLTWSGANAAALGTGADEFTVDIKGRLWWQTVGSPQKYHAKSLRALCRKYEAARCGALNDVLDECGVRLLLDQQAQAMLSPSKL